MCRLLRVCRHAVNSKRLVFQRSLFAALAFAACGIASRAHAQSGPGFALQFNGTNNYVSVAHNTALNAYPLTITAWIKTSHNAAIYDGILSSYFPGGLDGYSLFVYSGHIRAWYFHNGANFIWNNGPGQDAQGIDGGPIADGRWHHVALVIGPGGGSIYVDGTLGQNLAWTGSPGPPTTNSTPLLIGRFSNISIYTNGVPGQIDEVTLWNRALGGTELNYLKHRSVPPNADGLLGYWKLDDGTGSTALDSTRDHFNGTLVNSPQWVPSSAPIVLQPVAQNCLKFNGVIGDVSVTHAADLDAFPLTVTAWVRSMRNTNFVEGLVSKYPDGLGNGYSMFVYKGHLRAWYFKNGNASVFGNSIDFEGLDAGLISDSNWHHVAFIVDANGGRVTVDGTVRTSSAWTLQNGETPGAPTTTTNLQIGQYGLNSVYPAFSGAIDEVSLWNTALDTNQIQAMMNFPLAGTEPNLVACWHFDEGTGNTASDATGNGHTGSLLLVGEVNWTGSTAFLGDGSVHLPGSLDYANFAQTFAINNSPGQPGFLLGVGASLWRFYDFGSPPASSTVVAQLDPSLQVSGSGTPVSLNSALFAVTNTFGAYNAFSPIPTGPASGQLTLTQTLNLQPASGIQLDSVDNLHQATVFLEHSENGGAFSNDATNGTPATQLFHFDGNFYFGSLLTYFTNIDNTPTISNVVAGDHLAIGLPLSADAGWLPTAPGHTFGDGSRIPVNLLVNGDVVIQTGANVPIHGPVPDQDMAGNLTYIRTNVVVSDAGILGTLNLLLPTGFSVSSSPTKHLTSPVLTFTNLSLDTSLHPQTTELVALGQFYAVDDSKPFWIATPTIKWEIPASEILIDNPSGVLFVRQQEDDILTSLQAQLSDPTQADRVSNDAYYRNAGIAGGTQVIVLTDTNGIAHLTTQITLNPPELRPHFPYGGGSPGNPIPTTTGVLAILNDLIDPTNGSLLLSGPVPLQYSQNCEDTNCSGASIAPAVLSFTPGGNQLNFTPDGGLLAYGVVPPAGLNWGYAGGTNFAQNTSEVSAGVYHMPGTFLRGDQTTLADTAQPGGLLYTGFGDASNPAYVERPDQPAYLDGLANYAGMNFRAPAQGWSFIANTNTGPYPLDPASKYYTRFSGVSGIHEAASFPTNLSLYGYPFTFKTYRLSFTNSIADESRTDGAVSLPYPSAFTQEFTRMKFLCSGGLDSAQVPSSSTPKMMAYWNTSINPQTIQFKPLSTESCSTANRYLVLGVETSLPVIPQAFHAMLGFKPDGNLVTAAAPLDGGIDSRFPVPGQISLKGTGTSTFPLSTVSDGYFNNWGTPNAPSNGFYNLAGKIRVPFFDDIKVHLHVTPSAGGSLAQVDIMGGWPAADSTDADRGWTVGKNNFFNTAKFDLNADGWPQIPGLGIQQYRASATETYHPRAQRDWIEVAKFDYPIEYDSALSRFEGFAPAKVILPVIDVDSNLKGLTPGKVDFDFAQDISFQLPVLKVLDFANDALNELNGPLNSVSNAIRSELGSAVSALGLTSGFQSLQSTLREDASSFFRPLLDPALGPVATRMRQALVTIQQANPAMLNASIDSVVTDVNNQLLAQIQSINGSAAGASGVIGKIDGVMNDADTTLSLFLRVLEKDSNGQRHVIKAIIQKLVEDQGPDLGFVADLGGNALDPLLADLEPTLAEIESELQDLKAQFDDLRGKVESVTGGFNEALSAVTNNTGAISQFLQQTANNVSNLVAVAVSQSSDYLTADPTAVENAIKEQLTLGFLSSAIPGNYQQTFRQFLSDKNFVLDQLMNVLFDQINRSIRDGLENEIQGSNDGIFNPMKGVGQMSQSLLSAKIRGSPTFNGDSLREIHLDASIQMNLPDPMSFPAFMDIKELDSQSTPLDCIPPGVPAAEVTLGAINVPLAWPGADSSSGNPLTLTAEARWTLQSNSVVGIGGLIQIGGGPSFEGCSLKSIGATFAIGETENYFATKADATVSILGIPVEFKAGIFAGHACSLDPLKYVDPEAGDVLGNPVEFTGLYIEYGGGLSLSDLLFGSSTCLLDLKAGISTAIFYQDGFKSGRVGFRQKESVEISLLCALSGSVDFELGASAGKTPTGYELDVTGSAQACGSLGYCPFCVSGCKRVTITGTVKTGGIDYHVDY